MLKQIPVAQLVPGMYVDKVVGSWIDHPFWRSSFPVRTAADVAKVRKAGIAEVWIDTARGLDVARVPVAAVPESIAPAPPPMPATAPPPAQPPRPDGKEIERARVIREQAKQTVASLFEQARLGRAVEPAACVPLVDEISESLTRDPGAFINLSRLKTQDEYTYLHSVSVCALMVGLARQLGLPAAQVRDIGLAGMMHDLGKALMPLDVLNKPDKLTPEEYDVMKTHPARGVELLRGGSGAGDTVLDVCLHHHEKIDGSGYPEGLAGDRISLVARMGAVCDVYDAITSNRPYKAGWDPAESLRRMATWKGHFDPRVFQAFVKMVGIYPVGSLVRLKSQRLAVVCEQRAESLLAPRVRACYSIAARRRIAPVYVDLASAGCSDDIAGVESPQQWPDLPDLDALWLPPAE